MLRQVDEGNLVVRRRTDPFPWGVRGHEEIAVVPKGIALVFLEVNKNLLLRDVESLRLDGNVSLERLRVHRRCASRAKKLPSPSVWRSVQERARRETSASRRRGVAHARLRGH